MDALRLLCRVMLIIPLVLLAIPVAVCLLVWTLAWGWAEAGDEHETLW